MPSKLIQRLFDKLRDSFESSVYFIEPRIDIFSLIPVFGFPLYYYVWHDLFPQPYENLWLRMLGCLLFIPLLLPRYWPSRFKRFMVIYWYFAVLYALPFFFIFMLLKNHGCEVWQLACLVALFFMMLLLDWTNLLLQLLIGGTAAWFAVYLTGESPKIPEDMLEYVPVYLFAAVGGGILKFNAEMVKQERQRAMLLAASTVAHELRTPLLGMKSGASGLQRYLPALLEAYHLAKREKLPVKPIRQAHLDAMDQVLDRIVSEADYSNVVIDMLLMNARPTGLDPRQHQRSSIRDCVKKALERYPFASEKERKLVKWQQSGDFAFRGSDILMVHVLFNLLKNALYHIAKAGKGEISIAIETAANENRLIFRDTGTGIPPEILPNIFRRFYSWSASDASGVGAGIGLTFCKTVLESFNAGIACDSKLGEYTEFVMTFPVEP